MISIAWKIYFWLLVLITCLGFGFDVYETLNGKPMGALDIFFYITSLVAIAGVFGYVYEYAMLNTSIWRIVLVVQSIAFVYLFYVMISVQPQIGTLAPVSTFLMISMLVVMLPEIRALYLYSFRSNYLWRM